MGQDGRYCPKTPYARAETRALMKEIELYIELPALACFPEVIFGLRNRRRSSPRHAKSCWPVSQR